MKTRLRLTNRFDPFEWLKLGRVTRESLAESLRRDDHLAFHDLVVFLLFVVVGLDSLPRQGAPEHVHQDVANGLQVVSSGLLDSQVGVDRGVSGGSR